MTYRCTKVIKPIFHLIALIKKILKYGVEGLQGSLESELPINVNGSIYGVGVNGRKYGNAITDIDIWRKKEL